MPKIRSKIKRTQVTEGAFYCCEYCMAQSFFSHDYFSMDHILSPKLGGTDELDNLANICQACNNHKHIFIEALDPITGNLVSLYHPRKDTWKDHFKWNKSFTIVIGVTSTGRATIEKLHLNREGLVNLRRVLVMVNVHPPKHSF